MNMHIGRFQKISVPTDEQLFGIPKAWGSSSKWNSRGMGEFFELEFRGNGGVSDLGFPEGTDKSVFIENANFVDFTSS